MANKVAPAFQSVASETGPATENALRTVWLDLQSLERKEITDIDLARSLIAPRVLQVSATGPVNNLDLGVASVIQFTGSSAQNLTGIIAPETGATRVVIVHVTGAGTITTKHLAGPTATNMLSNSTAGDVTLSTGKSAIYIYLSSLWRQVV